VRTKLGTVLEKPKHERDSMAHDRIAKLSAILGLANATVRRATPESAAYFNHDLVKAANALGMQAEEVRSVPPHLAWLCRELDI